MSEEDQELFGANTTNRLTIKEYLQKYLSYWPLFIISLILCVGGGLLYTRYTEPKYMASTLILVKGRESDGPESGDLLESSMNGKSKINLLDNEVQLMRSSSLMERVVARNGFNLSYYKQGSIRKIDLYQEAPFQLTTQFITDSSSISLTLTDLTAWGGTIKYGSEKKIQRIPFKWNQPVWLNGKRFSLTPKVDASTMKGNYIVEWNAVPQTAAEILSKFTVALLDNKTTIVQLNILIENLQRGVDILNAVSREYNLSDIESRNMITQNSMHFIDDRLEVVSRELSGVEGNLESFQGNNMLINVETQSSQSFANSNDVSKDLTAINIQQGVVQMINNYFNNPATSDRLVPSTLGLNDATLSTLITKFNELQLSKQRETPLVAVNSTVLADLNHQINDIRRSIIESLQNITRNLKLQEVNLRQKNSEYSQFLSSLPRKERVMQEIKRKRSITEGLYLYLLQKREEAAISSTSSTTSNYKQIDPAKGYGPVEPNAKNIKIYTALLGLFLPIGFIYLKDLLNDKINSKKDITDILQLPVLGEISHIKKQNTGHVVALDAHVFAEQFRMIRTNLSFIMKKNASKVVLVTSSVNNEGKTLISINLAAVLAIPGKKIALLEFDFRKPRIAKSLELKNAKGLTSYILGQTHDLAELYNVLTDIPNLHIYASGPTSYNSADILLNENITKLFGALKQQYDYVIIDSAPAELVSDAYILSEYSDAVLYVVRQNVTLKKQIDFVHEIVSTGKFKNLGFILNDVASNKKNVYNYAYTEEKQPGMWNRMKQFRMRTKVL